MALNNVNQYLNLRLVYTRRRKQRSLRTRDPIWTRISNMFYWLKKTTPSPWIQKFLLSIPFFRSIVIACLVHRVINPQLIYHLRKSQEPLLIVAPHYGMKDHPVIVAILGRFVRILTKDVQFSSAFANWFWRSTGATPITRGGKPKISEVRVIRDDWKAKGWVLMYPHGTYTYAHADASEENTYLTAPIEHGAAHLSWANNVQILVIGTALSRPGLFGYRYDVLIDSLLDPRDFDNAEMLHNEIQLRLDRATLSVHDPSHS